MYKIPGTGMRLRRVAIGSTVRRVPVLLNHPVMAGVILEILGPLFAKLYTKVRGHK